MRKETLNKLYVSIDLDFIGIYKLQDCKDNNLESNDNKISICMHYRYIALQRLMKQKHK